MADSAFIDIRSVLVERLIQATNNFELPANLAIAISPCQDARFGDYQANVAMILAKSLKKNPREVAQEIISKLQVDDLISKVEVAGAGFINFHLKTEFVTKQAQLLGSKSEIEIVKVSNPEITILDFAGPNIAKEMHVGHIRTHFLGDSVARIARYAGHKVITDNHLGDWGTQFGMIIYGYKNFLDKNAFESSPIAESERVYKKVYALGENDSTIKDAVRSELAKLQNGDDENVRIWKEISKHSVHELHKIYEQIGVTFDFELGESFYNPMLKDVVDELLRLRVAELSEGAICIFFRDEPALKDAAPMMIQKSDGAALYATSDLATILYRVKEWKAERILYFTDARQQLYFQQLFKASSKWLQLKSLATPTFRHIVFGSVLGPDKKPFKTRSGDPLKFTDLLIEAEQRALKIIEERKSDLSPEEKTRAARTLGIGALKYADLSQNRNLDYVFDWDKLLALQGNTAPYLIYAYVRIRSIFRSVDSGETGSKELAIQITEPEEVALAKHLIQFSDTIHSVLDDYRPHILCTYLYELASRFSRFYENCPVLKADEPTRSSRLALCDLTSRVLKKGLNLLGIETIEKM
jgi:arginyl-tRNA synthetase